MASTNSQGANLWDGNILVIGNTMMELFGLAMVLEICESLKGTKNTLKWTCDFTCKIWRKIKDWIL